MSLLRRRNMLRTQDNEQIGVNLFEVEDKGYINDSDGSNKGYHDSFVSKFIEVNPTNTYVIYVKTSVWMTDKLYCYDSNKQYLGLTRFASGNETTVQFLPNTAFVRYAVWKTDVESTYFKQIS